MIDHDRTRLAATISVVAVVFVLIGLSLLSFTRFVGWTIVVFGAFGAIQAVLVGLGLVTISRADGDTEPRREDERP